MTDSNSSDSHFPSVTPFRETILVADDDSHIREIVRFALHKAGYKTCEASDGRQCLEVFESLKPALIILDILMPEMDGTEVCKIIREQSVVPIIFLSSRDDEIDRIVGLELGGDDYLTKPFSPRELVARVKAVLRRMEKGRNGEHDVDCSSTLVNGKLRLIPERFQVFWDKEEILLTAVEFGILQALMNHPGKVYSRDELMEKAYNHDALVTDRTIDSHIRKLRSKFRLAGGEPIETVRGVGYKLGSCQ